VDDDDHLLHGLVRALRHQPYRVYTARSGEEAMAILKSRTVDLVVTDERMNGMSGTDLAAWIARELPDRMRIILTGNASAATAIRAINEGRVHRFLTKPCDAVQLAMVIRKALEEKDQLEQTRRVLEAIGEGEHLIPSPSGTWLLE
jgi:DNA-binding NtrC family response regulator